MPENLCGSNLASNLVLRFGVSCLGFGVWSLGFGVSCLGSGVQGLGFRISSAWCWTGEKKEDQGRVSNLGFGIWGLGLEVWGFGFLILGVGPARRKEDQASRKCFLEVPPISSTYFLLPRSSAAGPMPPPPPVSAKQGLLETKDTHRRRVLR